MVLREDVEFGVGKIELDVEQLHHVRSEQAVDIRAHHLARHDEKTQVGRRHRAKLERMGFDVLIRRHIAQKVEHLTGDSALQMERVGVFFADP